MLGYAESPKILDAPVSGGVPAAAEAGKLTFMMGGLEKVYLSAKSLLQVMGEKQSTVVVLEMARQVFLTFILHKNSQCDDDSDSLLILGT
ncbi:putative 3-hydroxyisobutyrate dehydrogenase, mitochondrial [Zea mays]|uniref:3-hydroxyisobutyrate dehydrogenase n=1 Tax=Zea mays TaxID=4577 RepID=A0A3L6ERY9_MAIZE|nr:putative 3-hydroxyisobutyrate dehydrogenase, mitochondrial [Zea mays]